MTELTTSTDREGNVFIVLVILGLHEQLGSCGTKGYQAAAIYAKFVGKLMLVRSLVTVPSS